MAARFPGAPDIAAFWRNLSEGVDGITRFSTDELTAAGVPPELTRDPSYVPMRGAIADDDKFDATLFEMGAHEAERTDPQQRIWLECAQAALEDAACDPRTWPGSIGVFAGVGSPEYLLQWPAACDRARNADYQLALGNEKDFVATRTSYKLGLRGPSLTLQTACSTSLVAISVACGQLLAGECDAAVAGAASLSIPSKAGYLYREGMILSPDGRCRPFDKLAHGTVPGDGVGAVVLKRLSRAQADGDRIYAVISGSAVNNDGDAKVGYTAPSSGRPKRKVITRALGRAGLLTARDVTFVEGHGTGTAMGDPIEFSALRDVFEADGVAPGSCALGSVKSNIGHLNVAAGVASLIKAVLAIQHRAIPGTLHFECAQFRRSVCETAAHSSSNAAPAPVVRLAVRWLRGSVRSASVEPTRTSLFRRAPARAPAAATGPAILEILPISAATPTAVASIARRMAVNLANSDASLASVARTLQTGRTARRERRASLSPPTSGVPREDFMVSLRRVPPRLMTAVRTLPFFSLDRVLNRRRWGSHSSPLSPECARNCNAPRPYSRPKQASI